ncbi:MAG TPA: response regulator transcription factor [Thermoleophilaceae bacterium]|nr:response regulator transcription factor [Thermoleophilaceae bacterium]
MLHILLADDHGIVRSGLRVLIERQEGMTVVAEAEDGVAAVDATLREEPDVAILDVAMPRMTGIQAAREIRSRRPRTAVVMLSMHDDERYLFDALRAGASGYVLKRAADEELIEAIRSVSAGKPYLPAITQSTLVKEWLSRGDEAPRDPLTPREQDVVKLIAEAYTNRQIGEILKVSEKTVESHRANVLAKLGMRDRVELVRYAIRRGLIEA